MRDRREAGSKTCPSVRERDLLAQYVDLGSVERCAEISANLMAELELATRLTRTSRLAHKRVLALIERATHWLGEVRRHTLMDYARPTDQRGIEYVDVDTDLTRDGFEHRLRARVYLEDGTDDSDVPEGVVVELDYDGEDGTEHDADEYLDGAARKLWRDRVREIAYQQAIASGFGCQACGQMPWDCGCEVETVDAATEKESAHA